MKSSNDTPVRDYEVDKILRILMMGISILG
jgi:hypothetical protein